MIHLLWYVLVGLIAGVIAKSLMHVHMTIFWTIVLGIIGSILGGVVTHMFSRPSNQRYHPAGLIVSILGAILVLFICFKLKIHFPRLTRSSHPRLASYRNISWAWVVDRGLPCEFLPEIILLPLRWEHVGLGAISDLFRVSPSPLGLVESSG